MTKEEIIERFTEMMETQKCDALCACYECPINELCDAWEELLKK